MWRSLGLRRAKTTWGGQGEESEISEPQIYSESHQQPSINATKLQSTTQHPPHAFYTGLPHILDSRSLRYSHPHSQRSSLPPAIYDLIETLNLRKKLYIPWSQGPLGPRIQAGANSVLRLSPAKTCHRVHPNPKVSTIRPKLGDT